MIGHVWSRGQQPPIKICRRDSLRIRQHAPECSLHKCVLLGDSLYGYGQVRHREDDVQWICIILLDVWISSSFGTDQGRNVKMLMSEWVSAKARPRHQRLYAVMLTKKSKGIMARLSMGKKRMVSYSEMVRSNEVCEFVAGRKLYCLSRKVVIL